MFNRGAVEFKFLFQLEASILNDVAHSDRTNVVTIEIMGVNDFKKGAVGQAVSRCKSMGPL
jgi:hypothetical protein